MKNTFLGYLAFLTFLLCSFYLFSRLHITYEDHHTSLNDENLETDMYLENARHYVHENIYERSAYHIEQAKKSLRKLEKDIDIKSGNEVEMAIAELNRIEKELNEDSLISEDMNAAFARTLETVSLAELRISERYAESTNTDIALVALKYARVHLKNAMAYADLPERTYDLKVYMEIDSMINAPEMSPTEISAKLDHMIQEMNEIIHSHS